ncbi:MAG: hypothetical protein JWO49_2569, partial [Arthrobacter sp.]|nr:hypothetical protein [Arthrobacter sp.]
FWPWATRMAISGAGPPWFRSVAQTTSPPAGEFQDAGDELEQGRFVVGDFLREQPVSVGVDHDAVMVGFAGVDTGPQFRQSSLQSVGYM